MTPVQMFHVLPSQKIQSMDITDEQRMRIHRYDAGKKNTQIV